MPGHKPRVLDGTELIRVAAMTRSLLTELHELALDQTGRRRLADIHRTALETVRDNISEPLQIELTQFVLDIDKETATEAELRLAQAQLAGWLDGLFLSVKLTRQAKAKAKAQTKAGAGMLPGPAPGDQLPPMNPPFLGEANGGGYL